ncbi:MAG: hypothetical protein ACKO9X_26945 [Dolichospermum sp.]
MGWASCPPVVYLITPESAVSHIILYTMTLIFYIDYLTEKIIMYTKTLLTLRFLYLSL